MRFILIPCLIGLLLSCSGPKSELLPPKLAADSVFGRDEMVHILADVHLVEAALALQRNRKGDVPLLTQEYYDWLCRKYHMSLQRLRENLNYYKSDPQNFSKIYQDVVKDLSDQARKSTLPVSKKSIHK